MSYPFPGHFWRYLHKYVRIFEDTCINTFGFSATSNYRCIRFFQGIVRHIFVDVNSFNKLVYGVSAQGGWLGHRQYDTNPPVVDTLYYILFFLCLLWNWCFLHLCSTDSSTQCPATTCNELDSIFQIWLLHAGCLNAWFFPRNHTLS